MLTHVHTIICIKGLWSCHVRPRLCILKKAHVMWVRGEFGGIVINIIHSNDHSSLAEATASVHCTHS